MITEADLDNLAEKFALEKLADSLALAEIRCLTWSELRTQFATIWQELWANEVIIRVQELELSDAEALELAQANSIAEWH